MLWALLLAAGLGFALLTQGGSTPRYALTDDCRGIALEALSPEALASYVQALGQLMTDAAIKGSATIARLRSGETQPTTVDVNDPYMLALYAYSDTVPDACWNQPFELQRLEVATLPGQVLEEYAPVTETARKWYFRLVVTARILLISLGRPVAPPSELELALAGGDPSLIPPTGAPIDSGGFQGGTDTGGFQQGIDTGNGYQQGIDTGNGYQQGIDTGNGYQQGISISGARPGAINYYALAADCERGVVHPATILGGYVFR